MDSRHYGLEIDIVDKNIVKQSTVDNLIQSYYQNKYSITHIRSVIVCKHSQGVDFKHKIKLEKDLLDAVTCYTKTSEGLIVWKDISKHCKGYMTSGMDICYRFTKCKKCNPEIRGYYYDKGWFFYRLIKIS